MRTTVEQFVQDLRYGVRTLVQSRAFVATAVLTLAIGIALLAVAFTVVDAYVLRPYAVRDPQQLHQIGWRSRDAGGQSFRWSEYEELRGRSELFESAVAESTRFISSSGRPVAAALVSDNYFDALAPAVFMGRTWRQDEGAAGSEAVVLSYQAWTRLFARDPAVVGRDVDINGRPFPVIGVLRPEFTGLGDTPRDLWMSFRAYAALARPDWLGARQPQVVEIIARLRPEIEASQAQAALTPFMAHAVGRMDDVRADVSRRASPNPLSVQLLAVLMPVFAAFGLVLVAACANVSNVMLARAVARQREIAVRLSLGASRGRLVRQLLTEGLIIGGLAGVAALFATAWLLRGGMAAFANTLPPSVAVLLRLAPMSVDYRVFIFCAAVAALAPLLFALLPALQASRVTLMDVLRGQGAGALSGSRLRSALVGGQVAIGTVLVIVAVTLARNGAAIGDIDLGYDTGGVVSINVRGEGTAAIARLAEVLRRDSGIAEVALTAGNPLFVRARDIAAAPAERRVVHGTRYTFVSPEYFPLLRVPIERGRVFGPAEAASAARVAIVSASTAREFWPAEDPIGKTIRIEGAEGRPVDDLPGYSAVTVVGVVRDVVSGMIVDGPDAGHIYLPATAPDPHLNALLVRGRTPTTPEALDPSFRQVVQDPQVFEALPLEEMRAVQMYPLRAASWVGSFLAAVALLLSIAGLYGVLSFTIGQRTREIGIRMALGATAAGVIRLVVRYSVRLAGVGALAGALTAFAALSLLAAVIRLRSVSVVDGVAFVAAVGVVLVATIAAAYQPARRATRIDPSQALRAEG